MSPIQAITFSSQTPIQDKANGIQSKKNTEGKGQTAFSKLVQSLSKTEGEQVIESEQKQQLLLQLEDMVKAFQELPKDELSTEEQDLLYVMVQMLSLQTTEMQDKLQGNQNELMTIFQKLDQLLDELSTNSTKNFASLSDFVGGDEKNFFKKTPGEVGQLFKQFTALLETIEIEPQGLSPKSLNIEKVEQIKELFNKLISSTQELENEVENIDQSRINQLSTKPEPGLQSSGNQFFVQHSMDDSQVEQPLSKDNSQPLQGVSSEVKAPQAPAKSETSGESPTVRINHIIEDLKEVIRGSVRLGTTPEGTQLRVVITPEHLGHLDIRLTASEGKIAAQIFTSSVAAKEVLDLQIDQLRNTLLEQGIDIDRLEIKHQRSQQFGQQQAREDQRFSDQQQRQGNSSRNRNGYHVIEEEAAIVRQQGIDGSARVDYTI